MLQQVQQRFLQKDIDPALKNSKEVDGDVERNRDKFFPLAPFSMRYELPQIHLNQSGEIPSKRKGLLTEVSTKPTTKQKKNLCAIDQESFFL